MLKSGSPKALWDHHIDLEALIRSHTALDIYGLEGQVPETFMSSQMGDISSLCEFEWFEWVMFCSRRKLAQTTRCFLEDGLDLQSMLAVP